MPRQRKTAQGSDVTGDMTYLAGLWDTSIGIRGTSSQSAAVINDTENWPRELVKEFGIGKAEQFTSAKGKRYWGWFLTLQERLAIATAVEASGMSKHDENMIEKVKFRLQKGIDNAG